MRLRDILDFSLGGRASVGFVGFIFSACSGSILGIVRDCVYSYIESIGAWHVVPPASRWIIFLPGDYFDPCGNPYFLILLTPVFFVLLTSKDACRNQIALLKLICFQLVASTFLLWLLLLPMSSLAKVIENTSMSLATVILASSNLLLLVLMALKSRKRKLEIADKG